MSRPPGAPRHPTCVETTDLGAGTRAYVCSAYCPAPIPPDPERDARREAYRARERARVTRAFDAYLRYAYGHPTPYLEEAKVQHDAWWAGYEASEEHHKRNYGVSIPGVEELAE